MSKEQEIKIVPSIPVKTAGTEAKRLDYVPFLVALITVYFALVVLIAFIPLSGFMKVLALMLGSFLLFYLLNSINWYFNNK